MVVYRRVRGPMAAARSEAHFEQAGGVISNRVTRLQCFCWRMVCASCHHHIVLDGSACGPMSLSPSWMLKSVPLLMTLQGEPAVQRTMTSFPKFHSRHNWGRLSTDACFVYFMAAKFVNASCTVLAVSLGSNANPPRYLSSMPWFHSLASAQVNAIAGMPVPEKASM